MRSQRATADVRIVTSSDALEEETPPFETQMPPPNPACHAANLHGHFGSVARVPTSPSSSCLLTFRALSVFTSIVQHHYYFPLHFVQRLSSKANTLRPAIAPAGIPQNRSFLFDRLQGFIIATSQPVCAVALSGAGRYIARRYTAIFVPLSHCCVTV